MSSDDQDTSRFPTPDPHVVQEFQDLMKTLLPQSVASAAASSSSVPHKHPVDGKDDEDDGEIMENGVKRPMTKAEKQNAKKKRRKEREREAKMEEAAAKREEQEKEEMAKPVAFRLFSERPVVDVSLLPAAEEYEITSNPRHVPLEPNTVAKIRTLAAEAAFDPSNLQAEHHTATAPPRRRPRPVRTLRAASAPPSGALLIVRAHHSPADKAGAGGKMGKPKSGATIPRIDLFDMAPSTPVKMRQRTKRTRRPS